MSVVPEFKAFGVTGFSLNEKKENPVSKSQGQLPCSPSSTETKVMS